MSDWVNVVATKDIIENKPYSIEIDGAQIIVFKLKNEFYAIENICTHDGGELLGGCINENEIICPRHGARFSIKTGDALSAPAYEPIAIFPIRIENNMLQVRDDRFD